MGASQVSAYPCDLPVQHLPSQEVRSWNPHELITCYTYMKRYIEYILEKNKHSIIFDYIASNINLEYQVQIIYQSFLTLAKLRPEYKFLHNAYLKRIRESTNPSKFFISWKGKTPIGRFCYALCIM